LYLSAFDLNKYAITENIKKLSKSRDSKKLHSPRFITRSRKLFTCSTKVLNHPHTSLVIFQLFSFVIFAI